jgi:hypothetical protein
VCSGIRIETTFLFFHVMYNMYEQSLCSCALILFIFKFLLLVILDLCLFYAVEKINNNISHTNWLIGLCFGPSVKQKKITPNIYSQFFLWTQENKKIAVHTMTVCVCWFEIGDRNHRRWSMQAHSTPYHNISVFDCWPHVPCGDRWFHIPRYKPLQICLG